TDHPLPISRHGQSPEVARREVCDPQRRDHHPQKGQPSGRRCAWTELDFVFPAGRFWHAGNNRARDNQLAASGRWMARRVEELCRAGRAFAGALALTGDLGGVRTACRSKLRMLLTHRELLQSKAIAIENDLRGTLCVTSPSRRAWSNSFRRSYGDACTRS